MRRFGRATNGWRGARFAPALLVASLTAAMLPVPAVAGRGPSREDQALEEALLAEIKVLASDEFAGREPGTEGEAKTLRHIARAWFDIGLVSGTNDPGHPWFSPVSLIAREPAASSAQFGRNHRLLTLPADQILVLTSGRRTLVERAPLYFVGRGETMPPRTELAGRVALLLDRTRAVAGREGGGTPRSRGGAADGAPPAADDAGASPQNSNRQNALLAAGASAVITVLDGGRDLASVAARRRRVGYALASEALGGDLEAFITPEAMDRLLIGGGQALAGLEAEADRADFVPHLIDLSTSLEATTRETRISTHNVIGRLPGRHPGSGAVLLLAHWDHFGTCAQPPAEHLICNGAIDNASGVAALTEIARRLAHPPVGVAPMERDIYFLATTGEEMGLLGAEAFAEDPPLPLQQVVGALNFDSITIAPAGTALGVVGKGMTPLDKPIAEVARTLHRPLTDSTQPNAYIRRQDGWALMRHDVPAVMVTSAYGDIPRLEHFFDTDYHRPSDVVKDGIELGGAAEDVTFAVALTRYLADPAHWPAGLAGQKPDLAGKTPHTP